MFHLKILVGFILLIGIALTLSGCHDRDGMASSVLYWGKMPDEKRILQLKALGVKSLINLRTNNIPKTRQIAEREGLKFFHVKTGVFLKPSKAEIEKFVDIVSNPENQPVYVFCVGGRDRTAFYVGLYRVAMEGWTPAQAKAELREHRLRRIWPIFWQYDEVLSDNRKWIDQIVANHKVKRIQSRASSDGCPCERIKFVNLDEMNAQTM